MTDNSTPASRYSQRQFREAPVEVAARSESPTSAISALTKSTSAQRIRERREDCNRLTVNQLANVASPVIIERAIPRYAPTALEVEEAYDFACRAKQGGASDSESDGKSESGDEADHGRERVILDAAFAAEVERAAEIPEDDVTGVKVETEEAWAYGAPPGWKPPAAYSEDVVDSLFFYQLILPIHQIDNKSKNVSPIPNDPCW